MRLGFRKIVVPPVDLSFLCRESETEFVVIHSLKELISFLCGQQILNEMPSSSLQLLEEAELTSAGGTDFSEIRGHEEAKRVLEIAAAGGHHVLLNGPPGCGKSMLSDAFHTIFPDLDHEEMLEVYSIHQLASEQRNFSSRPPYRHPHHSASAVSLIGGGTFPKPGEISLAHNGILFLDELGEFARKALDMLRQPMETGEVTISRVRQTVQYPAAFTMIAATNPCPCGYLGSNERYCSCSPQQIRSYQLKASGPLLDRMDFILHLKSVGLEDSLVEESSAEIRTRIEMARTMQRERYSSGRLNGTVAFAELMRHAHLSTAQQRDIQQLCFERKWSNRTQAKLIRVARTISDLAGSDEITAVAVEEAAKWKTLASSYQVEPGEVAENG